MVLTLLLYTAFLSTTVDTALADTSGISDLNQEEGLENAYFLYDHESEHFTKIPKTEESVDSLLTLGYENRDRDSGLSFNVVRQALTIANEIQYGEGLAGAHNLIGNKYLDFGDQELAHQHFLRALKIEQEFDNPEGIASVLNNISLIYVEQELYEKAAQYLEDSIEIWKNEGLPEQAFIGTNNLGVIHRRQGNYEKALDYFWDTSKRAILEEETDSLSYIIATLNIGNTYRNIGEFKRAKIHLLSSIDYFRRHNLTSHIIFTSIVLGKLYRDEGSYDKALAYTDEGLQLATEEGIREKIKEAHNLFSSIYEIQGNDKLAFHHFRLFHQHSDTLQEMQRGERINDIQARFEVEQKDREIAILSKESELQEANLAQMNQLRTFLVTGVVVLFFIIGLLVNSNRIRKRNNHILQEKQREIEDKNKKLSVLNSEKDEFMSIAAHDLRNPLSSINLAVDLIDTEENMDRTTLSEYTELIRISSKRMLSLINDVLKIHSIDQADAKKLQTEVDANSIIDEALQHFKEPASSKQIRIHTVLESSIDRVKADKENLLRILDNLISNAIKYSQMNTTVIISTKQHGESIRISIRDQGQGISKAEQKKLFGKFTKLSSKPTGNETSTGLGLYIVKKICNKLHGRVWCESEPGCGATFIVELPIANPKTDVKASIPSLIRRKKKALT